MQVQAPLYRIVLAVTREGLDAARATAGSLVLHASPETEWVAAGERRAMSAFLENGELAGRFWAWDVDTGDPQEIFGVALSKARDKDFFFLQPGVILPPLGDLRLSWTSRRREGVATVSPLCESLGLASLDRRDAQETVPREHWKDVEQIDRICCEASQRELCEIPGFITECVYVTAGAAKAALAELSGRGNRGWFEFFFGVTTRLRFAHLLAAHVYAGLAATAPLRQRPREAVSWFVRAPEALPAVQSAVEAIRNGLPAADPPPRSVRARAIPRLLHITHSWGGGIEKWVREFAAADLRARHLVLSPHGAAPYHGSELRLFPDTEADAPAASFALRPAIPATAVEHEGYRAALDAVIHRYGVEEVVVSSLIGHSLDALRTGLPTLVVCHDYYPYCPALNITFGQTCESCAPARLEECTRGNPLHCHFPSVPPFAWLELRRAFAEATASPGIRLVAPSPSVVEHFGRLMPELSGRFILEPHGTRRISPPAPPPSLDPAQPLRVLVPGLLSTLKGKDLLLAMANSLACFAEVFLLGCGGYGEEFRGLPGFHVIPAYAWEDLPALVSRIAPDVALLASIAPETFSYTLQEMLDLQIPVLATRLGSFADSIEDGRNGFLAPPEPQAILERLRELSASRARLLEVHERLAHRARRTPVDMAARYHELLQTPEFSPRAYFAPDSISPAASVLPVSAQLFWRLPGADYEESESTRVFVMLKSFRQRVSLAIPALRAAPDQLRLDPADRPCFLTFSGLQVRDSTGAVVWRWNGALSAFEGQVLHDIVFAGRWKGECLWAITGGDPFLTLPLSREVLERVQGGGAVEFDTALCAAEEAAAALLDARAGAKDWQGELEQRDRLIRKLFHALAEAQARQRGGGAIS